MSNTNSSTSSGITTLGALQIVFITLKLAEIGQVATWSWWWVFCPVWIPFCIALVCIIIYAMFLILGFIISAIYDIIRNIKFNNIFSKCIEYCKNIYTRQ